MQETWFQSLGREDPLEKEMALHSNILPGESHGWKSLVGYSPRGRKESDTTERLHLTLPTADLGVVIVTGGQQRDSAIHLHVSVLPQTPSHPVLIVLL